MQASRWIEQSHSIMTGRGVLFTAGTLLIVAIYYWLYRRESSSRVLAWSAARFNSRAGGRFAAKLPGWILAAAVLLLPFALITFATRVATRELYYYYGTLDPDRLHWVGHNFLSWGVDFMLVVMLGGAYALFDAYLLRPEKVMSQAASLRQPRDNRLMRFVAATTTRLSAIKSGPIMTRCAGTRAGKLAIRFVATVIRLRASASASALYRLWSRAAAVITLLTMMHLFTNVDLTPGKRQWTPLPDSPKKEAILALAKDEKLPHLDLRVKHAPNYMNAWATYKDRGASIEFTDTLLNGQSEKAILAIAGHELYHVFVDDPFTLIALGGLASAMLVFIMIGVPKRGAPTGYSLFARLPVYVILFATAWPALQAVRCAVLRPYEGRADFVSVQVLVRRNLITPEDAKGALIKVNQTNGTDPDPIWLSKMFFYDHPPLNERLRNIDEAVKQVAVETARK